MKKKAEETKEPLFELGIAYQSFDRREISIEYLPKIICRKVYKRFYENRAVPIGENLLISPSCIESLSITDIHNEI
jgi:hypothetical protein